MDNKELALKRWKRWYYRQRSPGGTRSSVSFIGIDGEGGGTDDLGRQNYLLIRASDGSELFDANRRLETISCLEYILSLPRNSILVGYFFSYDATQMLRDLPTERIKRIFEPKSYGEGQSPYTWWGGYAIDFRPRQYFRVARLDRNTLQIIKGSSRTINEVGGFFQKAFVEALKDWQVGDLKTVAMIAAQKDRRAEFQKMTMAERRYCLAECELLAELMTKLRDVCSEVDINPQNWRGAGSLAARLHTKYQTPKRKDLPVHPARFEAAIMRAYYGGRFETTTIGRIKAPVYEYDINSAYPDGMRRLPCPIHTTWKAAKRNALADCVYSGATAVARVCFKHRPRNQLANLPVRFSGRLYWPLFGQGTYWSPEIIEAINAGTEITEWKEGYYATRNCDCKPFQWIENLYNYRKSLGKETKGFPLKLGINALYGKLAQRMGAAPWRNYIAAGLTTAFTRAKLIAATAAAPESILYLATDACFSRTPLSLDLGDGLGQWEQKPTRTTGLFIVQAGVYWSPGSEDMAKTRGIPRSQIIKKRRDFELAWAQGDPTITVPVKTFIGHRLALAWGRPETAGSWLTIGNGGREISFDWAEKRDANRYEIGDGFIKTYPRQGNLTVQSEPFDPKLLKYLEDQAMIEEAQDDYHPWGNSGE